MLNTKETYGDAVVSVISKSSLVCFGLGVLHVISSDVIQLLNVVGEHSWQFLS